ncbi:putative membrane protein of ER body-like protein [Cocos nucifera]|uniref:Vacuolar iron transporter n=1 Tax=Cocos nucifera TaxID=13894 RepID=A0A8K0N7F9_COCNU|nr:putative membrane protein of ER body-like protein [Cocos nucifera]
MAKKERATTEKDASTSISSQQAELLSTYQALGMDLEDAKTVVNVLSKYQDILVDEKMTARKGMLPPRQTEKPWKSGLITFASFISFGSVPLLSFVILIPFTGDDSTKFLGACLLSALALALLGLARAKISGQYLHSVAATLFNGCIAATCAYLIGWMLRNLAGLHD